MSGLEEYELIAVYRYVDEHGDVLYERGRFHAVGADRRRRRFRERRTPSEDWAKSSEFLLGEIRRVPYRLPELIVAVTDNIIFLCEGEKDVEAIRRRGLVATTTFAQPGTWDDDEARFFAGARVVILPDNDDQGRRYAQLLAAVLDGVARSIAVVELPGLGSGQDVSDWLENGGSGMELLALARRALSTGVGEPQRFE